MISLVSWCATQLSKARPVFSYQSAIHFATLTLVLQCHPYSRAFDDFVPRSHASPGQIAQRHSEHNRINFQNGSHLDFLGVFSPDTKFHKPSKLGSMQTGGVSATQQQIVPPRMLQSYERAIESFAPPNHATAVPEGDSLPRRALSIAATFAYGHLNVLRSPNYVTTDSTGRVIVSDPAGTAIHIIDPVRKNSFRIVAGPGMRVEIPGDVAVDANDNIYIVDSLQAMVQVYDPNGRFLRQIGNFRGEKMYQHLTGIAIDRTAGHLYLADGPRHMVFILDLDGNVLRSAGKYSTRSAPGELQRRTAFGPELFDYPRDIAVGEREVAVLDRGGTRVQILDMDCNLKGSFSIQRATLDEGFGVGIDKDGQFYVSYSHSAEIRIFDRQGKVAGSFGHSGFRAGQFAVPVGLWIDAKNRMYVADELNAQVQLYQIENVADDREGAAGEQDINRGE